MSYLNERPSLPGADREGLAEWLTARRYEGIVWHHPDGRMAKLKRRDFPTERYDRGQPPGPVTAKGSTP